MSSAAELSMTVPLERDHDAGSSLYSAFLSAWHNRQRPYLRGISSSASLAVLDVIPAGASIEQSLEDNQGAVALATAPDFTMLVAAGSFGTSIQVTAHTHERLDEIAAEIESRLPHEPVGSVNLRVVSQLSTRWQAIDAPTWAEIDHNYPPATRSALRALLGIRAPAKSGQLILWHGPPGTGKTTAIRALMAAWTSWCDPIYVSDADRLFKDADYLASLLATPSRDSVAATLTAAGSQTDRWRLVITEDTDEFLRRSAREDSPAAMGRLLNITDGLLGDRLNVIVLLTTNEELSRLHPALVRPGRCLSQIEFPEFSRPEASRWLGRPARGQMTLAELLVERGDLNSDDNGTFASSSTGVYL